MCLTLKNKDVKSKKATKDIVVYKRVLSENTVKKGYHGKEFTGVILDEICTGKISELGSCSFFCTNNSNLDGKYTENRLGYKYSWAFDSNVRKILVDGENIIVYSESLKTPYQKSSVKLGETYTSKLEKNEHEVYRGIHSFDSLEEAERDGWGVYVKCTIPKDSIYYKGKFNDSVSYASNALKYIEIVE